MNNPVLISEDYRRIQAELHRDPLYGIASTHYVSIVGEIIRNTGITEVLDYGAGKGRLGAGLDALFDQPLTIHHYDPAVPEWSAAPQPCDLVACIDVLEHIEPELLDNVLNDLKRVTRRFGVFSVHTGAAMKTLADGRNAHLTQQPASWWLPKFFERFELRLFNAHAEEGFYVVVKPRQR